MTSLFHRSNTCHGQHAWLAGSERALIQSAVQRLLKPRGLDLESYGTTRYLRCDVSAPRQEVCRLQWSTRRVLLVECLSEEIFERYENLGLRQRQWGSMDDSNVLETISDALEYFSACPELACVIEELLRSIHVLSVDDISIDVSHSDPDVPLSAFVSVPPRFTRNASLRVCESLLHECMHLQLSLVENSVPLVHHNLPVLYSPWRKELRPPSGLLHGVYVFNAIQKFFVLLKKVTIRRADLDYLGRRSMEIDQELREARESLRSSDLTREGCKLLDLLDSEVGLS